MKENREVWYWKGLDEFCDAHENSHFLIESQGRKHKEERSYKEGRDSAHQLIHHPQDLLLERLLKRPNQTPWISYTQSHSLLSFIHLPSFDANKVCMMIDSWSQFKRMNQWKNKQCWTFNQTVVEANPSFCSSTSSPSSSFQPHWLIHCIKWRWSK